MGKKVKLKRLIEMKVKEAINRRMNEEEYDEEYIEQLRFQIEEAMGLVEEAQNIVDGVMSEIGGRPEAHYESYGSYGFDQLLGNGNPYSEGLHTILEEYFDEAFGGEDEDDF